MAALCVPVTDIFRRNSEALLPLVEAVSFKGPASDHYPGKLEFLESSVSLADGGFGKRLHELGVTDELRSGRFDSFACDLGPAWTAPGTVQSPSGFPRYVPGGEPIGTDEYLERAAESVNVLRTLFDGRIKVENLNYFPTGAYEKVCDPGFITHLTDELEIELLLDLAHAKVSAANLDLALDTYLENLPLGRVSEIHVSGTRVIEGVLEDAHELPSADELAILVRILDGGPIHFVTLEYYRADAELVAGYRRLDELLSETDA